MLTRNCIFAFQDCSYRRTTGLAAVKTESAIASSAYMGVQLRDLTPDRAAELRLTDTSGAEVVALAAAGPARKAGLQEGDVIVTLNDYDDKSPAGCNMILRDGVKRGEPAWDRAHTQMRKTLP